MISVIGGAINTDELKQILKATYEKDKKDIGNYKIDKKLSGLRAKVYTNKETGKNVIAIRGTQGIHDMITDINLLFDNKNTKRFRHAKKVYDRVVNKYGKDNLILSGHSLGSSLAQEVGKKNKDEIYTLNKPVTPIDILKGRKVPKNQTDIRTSIDLVSALRPLQKGKKEITIKSDSLNLFDQHKTDKLDKLNNIMIGGRLHYI